jgi:glycolate oxidase
MGIFKHVEDAMNAVYKSLAKGAMPVAMEFMDSLVVKALREKLNVDLPEWAGALLIGDVDGNTQEEIDYQLNILKSSFKEEGAKEFRIAQNEEESKEIWFARRNASPAITIYGSKKLNEDISVPRSKLPEALNGIYKIGEKYGVLIPCFGHAGDGNIHVNVMVDGSNEDELKRGYQAVEEVFKYVVSLGGTLSGEHGIGLSKAPFMKIAFSDAELELFRRIKKAFDPNGILNPGKMGL